MDVVRSPGRRERTDVRNAIGGASVADKAKAMAAYDALKDGEYDIIVAARYHVKIEDIIVMKTTTAKVWGWGGKITGAPTAIGPSN